MIKQLKKVFPSLCTYEELQTQHTDYNWYVTNDNEVIGILKKELSAKDESLLATFLHPYQLSFPTRTTIEHDWYQLIYSTNRLKHLPTARNFRFVHFFIEHELIDPVTFKEAIVDLFAQNIPVLWINQSEGIIVEEEQDEPISYEQIIDVLMSDLYGKIIFFVGSYQQSFHNVQQYYESIIKGAEIARNNVKKPVSTYLDIIPHLLITQSDEMIRKRISLSALHQYHNDEETLNMIHVFFNSNLNVSETAKKLYMHRNSLQYRLDKFIETTHIDIRQFHQAMAVYLSLLASKSL